METQPPALTNENITEQLKETTGEIKPMANLEDQLGHDPDKLGAAMNLLPCQWVEDLITKTDEHKLLLNDKSILFVNHIEDISKDAQGRIWIKFTLPRSRDWNTKGITVLNDQIPNKVMAIPAEFIAAVMPFSCRHDGYLHLDVCGDCNMPTDDIMRIAAEPFPATKRFIDSDPSIIYANYGKKQLVNVDVPVASYEPGQEVTVGSDKLLIKACEIGYLYHLVYPNDPTVIVGTITEKELLLSQHHLDEIDTPAETTAPDTPPVQ